MNKRSPLVVASEYSWRLIVVALAVALGLFLAIELRTVVLPAIVAVFTTSVLAPVAGYLKRRGLHPLLATWATFGGALVLLGLLVAVLAPEVASQMDDLGASVQEGFRDVVQWLTTGPLDLSQEQVDRYIDQASEQLTNNREQIFSGVLAGATKVAEFVAELVLTIVLTFFYLKDGDRMWNWFASLFNSRNEKHVRAIGAMAWETIGRFMRGTAFVGLVDAVLIAMAMIVLGVPLVAPIALLTFFGGFFPLVGATLAGIVAALVALVTEGATDALILAGAVLVIQQVEGDVLQPLVVGKVLGLHPVAILLAIAGGAVLGGIPGAFLAVPLTSVTAKAVGYIREQQSPGRDSPNEVRV